jgi:hypothetical protein
MFDGNPKTAWVYSATSNKQWDETEWVSRYGVELTPSHTVVVDGLRIMNGHNRSRERFYENNRAVRLKVDLETASGHIVRDVSLADTPGWHGVRLPRTLAKSIKIGFTGIKRGPANDLCISELQLLRNGKPLNLHMPQAVMFQDGFEGCTSGYLISHDGTQLAEVTNALGTLTYGAKMAGTWEVLRVILLNSG